MNNKKYWVTIIILVIVYILFFPIIEGCKWYDGDCFYREARAELERIAKELQAIGDAFHKVGELPPKIGNIISAISNFNIK